MFETTGKVFRLARKVIPDVGKVMKKSDSPAEAVGEAKQDAKEGTQEAAKEQFKQS
ncbi:hypothetical protein [Salimicrobium flavidum]|uniref:hypothetical protein n=1 Tax=Salimicrobium flavidum TaxID=570947 RepID=UPI0013564AEE|nr:hypothetical protein [Salimicrobium flavidum]